MAERGEPGRNGGAAISLAWLICSLFYFHQYVMRSAPAVMAPQLTEAFNLTTAGFAALVGLFYYGYAPFSLVAGVAMDQLGPRRVVPLGAAAIGVGALLFATGDPTWAAVGRFVQGAGGVFALIGAAYIAATNFPASRAATLIGMTQMFGMAGGSAGQFVVGPAIGAGLDWRLFWTAMGAGGLILAVLIFVFTPKPGPRAVAAKENTRWLSSAVSAMAAVARNPQSILCGLIAGLMFLPTTIFDMVWGVRYLQEAHGVDYAMAVLRSASVPFGWIIGCPLLGLLSDRLGRRKPVIIGAALVLLVCMAVILHGPHDVLPPFVLGLVAGIASGAAMLPYTVIKEANRPEHGGTATGVVNFINFSLSAVLGPVFGGMLARASGGGPRDLSHYQQTFEPLLWGVGLAVVLTVLLRETGAKARTIPKPATAASVRPQT